MKTTHERTLPRVRVVWDEENLHHLEATKSPKQKITEPKTPYYAPDAGDGVGSPTPDYSRAKLESAVHAEAIRHALYEVTSDDQASTSRQSESDWISTEDDGFGGFGEYLERCDEGLEPNQARSFEEHRRKHYDEYRKAKLLSVNAEAVIDDDAGSREKDIGSSSNTAGSSSSSVEPLL